MTSEKFLELCAAGHAEWAIELLMIEGYDLLALDKNFILYIGKWRSSLSYVTEYFEYFPDRPAQEFIIGDGSFIVHSTPHDSINMFFDMLR